MLVYAGLLLLTRRAQIREDQSGDNLYYLGFLFTLVSLSFALYQFNGNGTEQIIENFGIALATTITGLVLRVCFNQMRHDPVETEREARMELAAAATRLRTDLLEVTQTLKSTLIAAQQQTAEVMIDYGKKFDEVGQTIIAKTNEAHSEFIENSKKLNQLNVKFMKGVEALIERIDEIKPPVSLLEDKLVPAVNSLIAAADEIRIRAKGDERFITQIGALVENAVVAGQQLEHRIKSISDQSEQASGVISKLDEIGSKFSKSAEQFQQIAQYISQWGDMQKATQEKINVALANSTETAGASVVALHQKVSDVLSAINASSVSSVSAISDLVQKSISSQAIVYSELEKSIGNALATTRSHNSELAQELAKSREYTAKVHAALVSMTESLSNELDSNQEKIASVG
jgi:hypothetical protein